MKTTNIFKKQLKDYANSLTNDLKYLDKEIAECKEDINYSNRKIKLFKARQDLTRKQLEANNKQIKELN